MDYSIKNDLFVLGTCRGAQVINCFYNGKLEIINNLSHMAKLHTIKLENKKIEVNSYHRYKINESKLPPELEILGICESDNSIEYFKIKNKSIFGIMWHPERKKLIQNKEFNKELIKKIFKIK
ncbi:MAG: gamma-glutamyl-gamma-aminobutyrate hydrolase family protein [Nanoarchaeales archaeon]|nr:gamma-glutamyl-gamma-aminobutyrate hydrolase family protein [Nanoarchaeales archaeon]